MNIKMSFFRKASATGIILCILAALFTGCIISKEETKEQKKWVDQMNNTFTDDHFEYSRPAFDILGGQSEYEAMIKSEKFPDEEIFVRQTEEGLITNYNQILFSAEAEDFVINYFSGKFEFDDIDGKYQNNNGLTPIQKMSSDEYIQHYVHMDHAGIIIYRKDGIFPDEYDMKDLLINICKEREEVCDFTIYFCKEKTTMEEAEKSCECYFDLSMTTEHRIANIKYKYKENKNSHFLMNDYSW